MVEEEARAIPKLALRAAKGRGKCLLWFHDWDIWQEPQRDYKHSTWSIGFSSTTTDKTPFFYQRRYCFRCMIMETRKVK